jgi:hypothetical protein
MIYNVDVGIFWRSSRGYNHMFDACLADVLFNSMIGISEPADSQVGLGQEVTNRRSFDTCFREKFAPADVLVVECLIHDLGSKGQGQYDGVAYQCNMWIGVFHPQYL